LPKVLQQVSHILVVSLAFNFRDYFTWHAHHRRPTDYEVANRQHGLLVCLIAWRAFAPHFHSSVIWLLAPKSLPSPRLLCKQKLPTVVCSSNSGICKNAGNLSLQVLTTETLVTSVTKQTLWKEKTTATIQVLVTLVTKLTIGTIIQWL
jgi:hypothetical protein